VRRSRGIESGTKILHTHGSSRIAGLSHRAAGCKRTWLLLLVIIASSCTVWPIPEALSASERPSEYEVEAAYLFNFGKFITWPPTTSQNRPLSICVIGEDPFGPSLDHIVAGEKIGGRAVVDKKISSVDEASACSILYISSSESSRLTRILSVVQDRPVLTVSDIPNFTDHGGIIQFVLHENRVRFVVNLGPAQRDGLALSSELLKVALSVKRAEDSQ
jgi:hypothetical protein